jgi:hypothetical protein
MVLSPPPSVRSGCEQGTCRDTDGQPEPAQDVASGTSLVMNVTMGEGLKLILDL